jgi:signal transduction histidine kinase/ActR/RegA family two-component response regulator
MTEELLPQTRTILERPYMKFVPFGVDERGERVNDVSGMIVHDNVEYLEEWVTRTKGADAAAQAMGDLCRLLNDRIRDSAYHVTLDQLKNVWNSYSYEFTSYLREFCRELSRDPAFHINVGREKHISPLIQTLGRPFSLAQIHRMYPYFAQKYATGLEYSVLEVTDTSAVLRLNLTDQVYEQFGPYRKACVAQICESAKGRIAMVPPRLHLLPASQVTDRACIVKGDDYCEWDIRWKRQSQRYSAWPFWGVGIGLATAASMRVAYPAMSLGEVILAGLIPMLIAGILMNRHLRRESQQRETLIQEQISAVESRHEELRAAYLQQEQTRVELRRKVAQLTALHRAGLLFSSTLDRETLMQKVLEALTSDLQYDRAMVSFYDPVRQVVKDARVLGVSPEIQAFVRAREIPVTDPMSPEGIVLLQGRPLLVGDVQAVWDRIHPLNQQLALLTQTKTWIAVPLKTKDRILGSLTVDRMQEHSLTQDDLELMMTVAHQVAIALDNASAYEQIEDLNVGLEAKVRERTAELEQADRLRSQFLSHVSHELKTPLTSIKGFLQNLLDGLTGPINEKQQRYLSRMLDNSERLIRMIEDLLDRTRIQSGRLDLVPGEIDLGHCVADAVEQLRLLAQAKRQTLEATAPPAPLIVWADCDRLIQIVTNLVQNAVKFTPEGGRIVVTVRQESQALAGVSVRDTGPGIPQEFLDQIFDPFFRIKQARTGTKGLGLGLSIVRTLVELQGGTIVARSDAGQGAELSFTIPLVPTMAVSLGGASAEAPRILVVDDDPDIRQLLQDRLRATGYRVQLAVDGVRALEAVRAETFEGMILDIGISSMDGMEVLRQIRRWDQQIPIVMVTASGSKEFAVRTISMGAQAYLLKPFEIDELQRVADYWFRPLERLSSESPMSRVRQGE